MGSRTVRHPIIAGSRVGGLPHGAPARALGGLVEAKQKREEREGRGQGWGRGGAAAECTVWEGLLSESREQLAVSLSVIAIGDSNLYEMLIYYFYDIFFYVQ